MAFMMRSELREEEERHRGQKSRNIWRRGTDVIERDERRQ